MIPEQKFRRRVNSRYSEPIDKLVLDPEQWYTLAHKKHTLQIKDITKLNLGDKLDLLLLDNNVWRNTISKDKIKNQIYSPESFFGYSFGTYIHSHELCGTLLLHLADTAILIDGFEFYVEYTDDQWYPLSDGYLLINDSNDIHWTELPLDTKIGYRGPAIYKSILNILPNIIIR